MPFVNIIDTTLFDVAAPPYPPLIQEHLNWIRHYMHNPEYPNGMPLEEFITGQRDIAAIEDDVRVQLDRNGKIPAAGPSGVPPPGMYPSRKPGAGEIPCLRPELKDGVAELVAGNRGIQTATSDLAQKSQEELLARVAEGQTVRTRTLQAYENCFLASYQQALSSMCLESYVETQHFCFSSFREAVICDETGHNVRERRAVRAKDEAGEGQVAADGSVQLELTPTEWTVIGALEAKLRGYIEAIRRLVHHGGKCDETCYFSEPIVGGQTQGELAELCQTCANMLKALVGLGICFDTRQVLVFQQQADEPTIFHVSNAGSLRFVGVTNVEPHLGFNRIWINGINRAIRWGFEGGTFTPFAQERIPAADTTPVTVERRNEIDEQVRARRRETLEQLTRDYWGTDVAKKDAATAIFDQFSEPYPQMPEPEGRRNPGRGRKAPARYAQESTAPAAKKARKK